MIKIDTYEVGNSFYRMNQRETLEIDRTIKQKGNWSHSIYFFIEKTNLKKYNDTDHPYAISIKNKKPLKCIVCYMDCFAGNPYTEDDMKQLINEVKSLTKIESNPNGNFMEWLGENGYAFQCYHDTDKSMEIAIPFTLLDNKDWEITNI